MIVSIHQPNFLPWFGYFAKIVRSDVFVILDNVQFTKGGFSNRVKIKSKNGEGVWLTVPVKVSEGTFRNINEIQIDYTKKWEKDIENKLRDFYKKAPFVNNTLQHFVDLFSAKTYSSLGELNTTLILDIIDLLGLRRKTLIAGAMDLPKISNNELLIEIIKRIGGDTYLSGLGGKKYMDEELYYNAGIKIIYNDVTVPEYEQVNGPAFVPNLSIIDMLFNIGIEGTKQLLKTVDISIQNVEKV